MLQPDLERFLNHFNKHTGANNWLNSIKTKEILTIKSTTIDEILIEKTNIKTIDLLKLDTQGTELSVLNGALETIKAGKIGAIKTEVAFSPIYKNQNNFSELDIFLRENGFLFIDCHFYHDVAERENKFTLSNKVTEKPKTTMVGDAYYVYDFEKNNIDNKNKVIRSAIILGLYGFYSSAYSLLKYVQFNEDEIELLLRELANESYSTKVKKIFKRITPTIISYWYSKIRTTLK